MKLHQKEVKAAKKTNYNNGSFCKIGAMRCYLIVLQCRSQSLYELFLNVTFFVELFFLNVEISDNPPRNCCDKNVEITYQALHIKIYLI